ncbi:MAG: ribonuclease HI [Lachnospiraceae bacterium]|nr:ribonuclease HI [Lachnospiraceae bacterium]
MKVRLFSDGSSRGNPGPGGYGAVLQYIDTKGQLHEREYSEGYKMTTNNRMELLGVITGLEALIKPCEVEVVSDSRYVTDAFNKHWIESWKKKEWMRSKNKPVPNNDLWKRLLKAMEPHRVSFSWIKGHDGHPENERCDRLATSAADREESLLLEDIHGSLTEDDHTQ